MNSPLAWILAAAFGVGLGALFYGGLWWTVRRGAIARRPALWFIGSLFVRLGVVGVGFYLVGNGDWRRLVSCLIGFILARILMLRLTAKWEVRGAS